MENASSLREELREALLACLEMIGKSHTYEEAWKKYERTRARANAILAEMDAFCLDSERYVDRTTGKIKENIGIVPTGDLLSALTELGGLAATLELFARDERWRGNAGSSIDSVLSISHYEQVEKKIIAELGLLRGRQAILEVKKSVLDTESELGLDFFAGQADALDGLIRTMTLYAREGALDLNRPDNLDEQEVNLVNLFGEYLRYKTSSKISYGGRCYVELERLEEIKALTFSYYLAEFNGQGYCLTLVEDRELVRALDDARDALAARFGF